MHLHVLLLYLYAVLLVVGGTIGYVKAKSIPSLLAGLISGLLILATAIGHRWIYSPYLALLVSLVLAVVMGRRYLRTQKAMPALLIVGVSLLVAAVQIYILVRR